MTLRQMRRRIDLQRKQAAKRFEKHRRLNLMASPGVHKFIIVMDHLKERFNIGKIFRSADAFGAHEIHMVGINFFDPAPSMGGFKWVPAKFYQDFEQSYDNLTQRGYTLFTLEPSENRSITDFKLPEKSAFIVGHEEFGISFDKADFEGIQALTIPQFGKVQSLNVSVAASIIMYEYVRQFEK